MTPWSTSHVGEPYLLVEALHQVPDVASHLLEEAIALLKPSLCRVQLNDVGFTPFKPRCEVISLMDMGPVHTGHVVQPERPSFCLLVVTIYQLVQILRPNVTCRQSCRFEKVMYTCNVTTLNVQRKDK